MKLKLILLAAIALPLICNSCQPTTEYHSVRVYEYSRTKPASPKPAPPKDDPREFVPKERF